MNLKILMPVILLILSCEEKNVYFNDTTVKTINGFTIVSDTIDINIEGYLYNGIKFKDAYYCQFIIRDEFHNEDLNNFYIIKKGYHSVGKVTLPMEIQFWDTDIHVRNDSIIAKSFDLTTYYLNLDKQEWESIKTVDDLIYEDEDYYITSVNFGEWGGATWFKDKKTGIDYEATIPTNEVSQLNGFYYLITEHSIDVIENPKLLYNCGKDYYKQFLDTDRLIKFNQRERSEYNKGVYNIFKDDRSEWDNKLKITTSIIHKDSLFYIMNEGLHTYIAKLDNGNLITVADIEHEVHIPQKQNKCCSPSSENIHLFYSDSKTFGFMEISNDTINMHYIKNYHVKN